MAAAGGDEGLIRALRIGGLDKAELLAALQAAGVRLNPLAETLFADDRFGTSREHVLVETVQVTAAELGLADGGTFDAIVARAAERGLALCPLELAPHLRLALLDQPEGAIGQPVTQHRAPPGSITIASAPVSDDEEAPRGFYVRRIEGVLWLRGYQSWSGHVWSGEDVFVFVK